MDTTAASAVLFDTDSDVTIVTPTGSPGVLDKVVFFTVVGTMTNSEDSVIKAISASGADNAGSIVLEDRLVSFNSNSNGTALDSRLERRGRLRLDSVVGLNADLTLNG